MPGVYSVLIKYMIIITYIYIYIYSNRIYYIISYYVNTHINLIFHTIEVVDLTEVAASELEMGSVDPWDGEPWT